MSVARQSWRQRLSGYWLGVLTVPALVAVSWLALVLYLRASIRLRLSGWFMEWGGIAPAYRDWNSVREVHGRVLYWGTFQQEGAGWRSRWVAIGQRSERPNKRDGIGLVIGRKTIAPTVSTATHR